MVQEVVPVDDFYDSIRYRRFRASPVVCRWVARLLVLDSVGKCIGPRYVIRISHSSTKGGAGEDEDGM
jgi:hypothetical protein